MREVYIVSAVRTPIGSFGGSLSTLSATQLGAAAIKAAVERSGIKPEYVNEVFMGNVLQANEGQAPVTQASIYAGLPDTTSGTTINKVCASGMKSIMLAAQSIALGDNDIVVAGGMESMSNVPYYLDKARNGYRMGNGQLIDGMVKDGLWDVYKDFHMGNATEMCAAKYNITREAQDAFAIESYKRSSSAHDKGLFNDEIIPVSVPVRGKDPVIVNTDEEYKNIKLDKVSALKPAFQKDGTITAANSSKLSDGASALVLMSKEKCEELGLKPLAKIRSYADAQVEPEWFSVAPSKALPLAAKKAGVAISDIEYFELNEAFAAQSLGRTRQLGLLDDDPRVNPNGGAIALGHPLGASGARLVMTAVNQLHRSKAKRAITTMCIGVGQGIAMLIERV